MQKLNLDNCHITIEHFVPNIIHDKNLYDTVEVESGMLICQILCPHNAKRMDESCIKIIQMLEAYDAGYIRAIHGEKYGLHHVFCINGNQLKYRYIGGNAMEFQANILTLVYNTDMHMSVIQDCISAGANTEMCPDNRRYFDIILDNHYLSENDGQDNIFIKTMQTQKERFQKAMMDNIRIF